MFFDGRGAAHFVMPLIGSDAHCPFILFIGFEICLEGREGANCCEGCGRLGRTSVLLLSSLRT